MSDADLTWVLNGFDARRDEMLRMQLEKPYPRSGVWHYADFALAALYLNERVEEANAALVKIRKEFPVDPDPKRERGDPEVHDLHWSINLLHRIYFFFNRRSPYFPGRLTSEAEAALLEMFWESARRHCRIEYASTERTWWVWGSEDHGAMSRSGFWGTAHILKDANDYRDRRYEDGSTPAEMAAAWDAFFKRYARERAGKGLLVEIGSTYNTYTLQGWYNMTDFSGDPILRKRMKMLLDLFWADWAIEQIDGVRGGGKHRIYPGRTSTRGVFSSGRGMAWYYFGLGNPRSKHPGHMCCATSTYRPPLCVVDMALDVQGRGTYEYASRRPGLNLLPKPEEADWSTYVLRHDYGGILRYSYCTPDFIMGTSMVEARPHEHWSAISSQNRWDGVVFAGHPDARIFVQPLQPKRGSFYNPYWSVQHKGTMIIQKLRTHKHARGQRIWFHKSLKRTEEDGWVFAEAQQAYAAVKVVRGTTRWEPDASAQHRGKAGPLDDGLWLACEDPFAPIVIEVVRKQDCAGFEHFRSTTASASPEYRNGTVHYRSPHYGPVNYQPAQVYQSPFIQSNWGGGAIMLQKGDRHTRLDFTAE